MSLYYGSLFFLLKLKMLLKAYCFLHLLFYFTIFLVQDCKFKNLMLINQKQEQKYYSFCRNRFYVDCLFSSAIKITTKAILTINNIWL